MLDDRRPGRFAYVIDASGDDTVNSGFAYYVYENGIWKKLFEQEAMDIEISGHGHTNKEVLDLFSIQSRRPLFNGKVLAYRTEIDAVERDLSRIAALAEHPVHRRYEFIDAGDDKDDAAFVLDEKTYIVRNARLVGQLPLGSDMWETICYRLVIDEASAAKAGVIVPHEGETINGEDVYHITQAMDVRIIYDPKNKDWVIIGVLS
jgi:hypothetical protein